MAKTMRKYKDNYIRIDAAVSAILQAYHKGFGKKLSAYEYSDLSFEALNRAVANTHTRTYKRGDAVPQFRIWRDDEGNEVATVVSGFACPFCGSTDIKGFCADCGAEILSAEVQVCNPAVPASQG